MKKIFAFIRFIYFATTVKGLTLNKLSYIGKSATIKVGKYGKIVCSGSLRLDKFSEIEANGILNIGERMVLNAYSRIISHESINIGNNVIIARFVTILDHDHKYNFDDDVVNFSSYDTCPISIGNNVWIGDKVTILKGTNVGNNVIIAANAVVTKSFPSNVLIGGVPAKIIRYLQN